MGWKRTVIDAAHRTGGIRRSGAAFGRRALRVLAYHRVADVDEPGFDTFRGNVSASPEEFDAQMAYVAERYRPVDLAEVAAAAEGRIDLGPDAVLVTFDDGYRDNLTAALPVLKKFSIPAVVFLATDHVDTDTPFWWDRVAWCFAHTDRVEADIPGIGHRNWGSQRDRSDVLVRYLEWLKKIPTAQKWRHVEALPGALGVSLDDAAFEGLTLSWSDVRSMRDSGIEFGGHTCSHPVLSRVTLAEAIDEITASRRRLTDELGDAPLAFAYPNGLSADYTPEIVAEVARAGYELAFTLLPGPARRREVIDHPLEVRRIYVHHGDHAARFAAKLAGFPRVLAAAR